MEIDVAGVLHSCARWSASTAASAAPSARAADVAAEHLRRRPRIDNLRFGAAMVAKGHVPKDMVGRRRGRA